MLALFDNCNDVKILYRPVQHRMHCGCCPHVSAGVCAAGGSVLDALGGWHHLVSGSASLVIKEAGIFPTHHHQRMHAYEGWCCSSAA
jgi:hypothetical protein